MNLRLTTCILLISVNIITIFACTNMPRIPMPNMAHLMRETWITGHKSEAEFISYFDANRDQLHSLEGIWTINISGQIIYRIAIAKYKSSEAHDYECAGVILESSSKEEIPGDTKIWLRSLSHDKTLTVAWHYQNKMVDLKKFIQIDNLTIKDNESELTLNKTYPISTKKENVISHSTTTNVH